jgi:hypothetical protein
MLCWKACRNKKTKKIAAGIIPNIAVIAGAKLKGLVIQGIPFSKEIELTTLPMSRSETKICE